MSNSEIKRIMGVAVLLILIDIGFAIIAAKVQGGSILKVNKEVLVLTGKGNIDETKELIWPL